MPRYIVYIPKGSRFGKWTTLSSPFRYAGRVTKVTARCDCGYVKDVIASDLRSGGTKSCRTCMQEGRTREADKVRWLVSQKSHPCSDCGKIFIPACMQFDHIPERGEKLFMVNLATCTKGWSLEELKDERAKCDLVCATCHHRRTWERKNLGSTPWLNTDHDGVFCEKCSWMGCDCCSNSSLKTPFHSDGARTLCHTCYLGE